MFATFLYLSKHFVILSLKTDFATDCIVNSRFWILDEVKFTHDIIYCYLQIFLVFTFLSCYFQNGWNVCIFHNFLILFVIYSYLYFS